MSNIIVKIGDGIETAATDVVKVVTDSVSFLNKAESVIVTAIKDQPAIKAAILQLISQANSVIADGSKAVASDGTNIAADGITITAAEVFFTYFEKTFIPLVESLYYNIKADLA